MKEMDDLKIACLSEEHLESVKALEKEMGPEIRLVAIESKASLYTLEAKMAPNQWQRVDTVYPQITNINAFYPSEELAKEAKGWLKGFLINNNLKPKPKKRPIRVRKVVNPEA